MRNKGLIYREEEIVESMMLISEIKTRSLIKLYVKVILHNVI